MPGLDLIELRRSKGRDNFFGQGLYFELGLAPRPLLTDRFEQLPCSEQTAGPEQHPIPGGAQQQRCAGHRQQRMDTHRLYHGKSNIQKPQTFLQVGRDIGYLTHLGRRLRHQELASSSQKFHTRIHD